MGAIGNPVFQPLKVHTNDPLIVVVGKRVVAPNLLQVLPVPGSLVLCSHDPKVRPVGAATHSKADDGMRVVVLFQEAVPWKGDRAKAMSTETLHLLKISLQWLNKLKEILLYTEHS